MSDIDPGTPANGGLSALTARKEVNHRSGTDQDDSPEGRIQRLRGVLKIITGCEHANARAMAEAALMNDDYALERYIKSGR